MPTTRKTTPTRRRTTPKAVPAVAAPIQLSSDGDDPYAAREPLFELDGATYTIPVEVPVADSLEYVRLVLEVGLAAADLFALRRTLEPDGYVALVSHRKLTQEQLTAVLKAVRGKFVSGDGPKALLASHR